MSKSHATVRCLLIPVGGGQILLPSAVIAEVSPYNKPKPVSENQPKWLLGIIDWRGQRVPLLSIEKALSLPVATSKKNRTVILYGLDFTQTMPFYAFKSADVPRTLAVTEEILTEPNTNLGAGLVFDVKIDKTEKAWLPDLGYLENLLKKYQVLSLSDATSSETS